MLLVRVMVAEVVVAVSISLVGELVRVYGFSTLTANPYPQHCHPRRYYGSYTKDTRHCSRKVVQKELMPLPSLLHANESLIFC